VGNIIDKVIGDIEFSIATDQDMLDVEHRNFPFSKERLINDAVEAHMAVVYALSGKREIYFREEYHKLLFNKRRAFERGKKYRDEIMKRIEKEIESLGFDPDAAPMPWFLKPQKGFGYNYIDDKEY